MADLTTSDWLSVAAILVSTISAGAAVLIYLNSLRQRKLAEAEHERRRLDQELRMYQDIATGNRWNWRPVDVGPTETDYPAYQAWRYRCVDYAPLVAPSIQEIYRKWVQVLRNYARGREPEYDALFRQIADFASRRVTEISAQLRKLG